MHHSSTLPWTDLAVLLAYVGGIFALGCWFARRSNNTEEFMAAGRSLPGWVVGLSLFGTYTSSISFLGNPGSSYAGNWNAFALSLSLPIAAVAAAWWFIPYYRRSGNVSAYSRLEERFGPWARLYATTFYLLTQIARLGTITFLVSTAVAPLTGWDIREIIVVVGVLVTVYTLLGGIEAVIWTDVAQAFVLTAGIVASICVLLLGMPEGPGQVFTIAAEHDKFSLGSFGTSLSEKTFWVVFIYGLCINLQNFGIDQSYVQRYFTAKSDRDAARSGLIGALLCLPVAAMLFFLGTSLFAYYTARPELLAGKSGDDVFPHFIVSGLPAGMTGLLIAAVLAAGMSSLDTSLNSSATLLLQDIYKRYLRPLAGERESMLVLRGTTVVWGAIGTCAALALVGTEGMLDAWFKLSGLFSGGMLGLFLLGLISRRAGNPAAATGVLTAVSLMMWMSLSKFDWWPARLSEFRSPLHDYLAIVLGTLSILFVGLLVASLAPRPRGDSSSA
ncbi:MAG: sodium:solute symporter [Planctomycetaceae bacterium]